MLVNPVLEIHDGRVILKLNDTEVARGTTRQTDGFSVKTEPLDDSITVTLTIPRSAEVRFLRPQIEDTLRAVAGTYYAVIYRSSVDGQTGRPMLEAMDQIARWKSDAGTSPEMSETQATQRPRKTASPTKGDSVAAEFERDFPLPTAEEDNQVSSSGLEEAEEVPGLRLQSETQIIVDKSQPHLFLVSEDSSLEQIATQLFGSKSAVLDFAFEPIPAPNARSPKRYVRALRPLKLTVGALGLLRRALDQALRDDVAWTVAKLSQGRIDDADEWALTERTMRWSQRSEIIDAGGENYFDRYLDALAAHTLRQPHWYTVTITSSRHTALEWLLIETDEKSEQIKKAIALRSRRWKTGYRVSDGSPELNVNDVAGRFYWSTGSGIQILIVQKLADEALFERADIRTRNNLVWAGMKIIVPGTDGRFRGYAVQFSSILGNVHPLDDPKGHFAWFYPGTVLIRPGETRLGIGAGEGQLKEVRQSALTEALAQSTAKSPWPMLGLDYDVLDLLTIHQRVEVFEKVINGPGLHDELGIAFLSRVLASTPNSAFALLERKLTEKGVLDKLLRSTSVGKVQLGQAFTVKALGAFPISLGSLETLPTFHLGKEGTTRHMLDVPTEQVTTTLVPRSQWSPAKGVGLGAEPATAGEAPGPAPRTALRFKPVTLAGYVSTHHEGKLSQPLHPLELVRVEIHGPQAQTRLMTAMELAMIASVPDTAAIWEAIGRISTMHMIYGGVAGLTRSVAAPVVAEGALARAEAGAAAEAGAEAATAAAARRLAAQQFISRMLLASSMVAVDVYRDELSRTEAGRAFLAVYDIAMVTLAARDIYRLASSGVLRELARRGGIVLRQMGAQVSPALREAVETAQDLQTTIDRLLAEKKISITPDGVSFNVPNGEQTFKHIFFAVRAERATERIIGGLRQAGLATGSAEATLAQLQRLAEKGEEFARAYNGVARRAASLPPGQVEAYLSAVESLRVACPVKAQLGLAGLLNASGKAHVVDPVAFLKDAEWLVTRPGIDPDAIATLAQKANVRAADLSWLRSTGLSTQDLNFMAKDPKTNWDLFRRAAAEPTNRKLQILVRARLRGVAGELVTEQAASKLFPSHRLTGRQLELEGGHIIDFELTAADNASSRHALEVKGWTGDTWRNALNAWEANSAAGVKLTKEQSDLVKQVQGVLNQLNDASQAPRGKPFLVVTTGLSGPTREKLLRFLQQNATGTELRAISEAEMLAVSKRLRAALGLPETLVEGEL